MRSALFSRLLIVPVTAVVAWGVLVLLFADVLPAPWRTAGATALGALGLTMLVALWRQRWRLPVALCLTAALCAAVVGWRGITPSNNRDWLPEVARLAHATIDGNLVTVHDIRNFDYRSETDFTPQYYDRTFDVRELSGVDIFAVYWMGPAIAHIFLSFEFVNGSHLAISIETRKERGEGYSTLLGFFRHYELYYVVADERDVVRLRTNYRVPPEDVYVYRAQGPIENARRLFLEYMNRLNALAEKPEFYNTLEHNCTTGAWLNARVNPGHAPLSWKLLLSGYAPEYLYEIGRLDQSLPFADLQRLGHVNARARAADDAPDFSQRIREGIPSMQP